MGEGDMNALGGEKGDDGKQSERALVIGTSTQG